MPDEDHLLAQQLQANDNRAWESFCLKYSGPLLSAVRLRFGCPEELAEEIVHLTFIRCVKSIRNFNPARGRLFDWLKAIARHEACTVLRKAAPPGQVQLDTADQQWLERIDQAELPDEQLCRQEVRTLILDTVMELSSQYRQALVMKYLEDRRVADMAAALGQSEKAVESLLTRSRQALREKLTQRFRRPATYGGNWL